MFFSSPFLCALNFFFIKTLHSNMDQQDKVNEKKIHTFAIYCVDQSIYDWTFSSTISWWQFFSNICWKSLLSFWMDKKHCIELLWDKKNEIMQMTLFYRLQSALKIRSITITICHNQRKFWVCITSVKQVGTNYYTHCWVSVIATEKQQWKSWHPNSEYIASSYLNEVDIKYM